VATRVLSDRHSPQILHPLHQSSCQVLVVHYGFIIVPASLETSSQKFRIRLLSNPFLASQLQGSVIGDNKNGCTRYYTKYVNNAK